MGRFILTEAVRLNEKMEFLKKGYHHPFPYLPSKVVSTIETTVSILEI
jgi:hypothetical protein